MKMTLVEVLFILCWMVGSCSSQILHSLDRMEEAIRSQSILADRLDDYLQYEYRRLQQIELAMRKLRVASVSRNLNREELEKTMSHPVKALRMVSSIYVDVESTRLLIEPTPIPQALNSTFKLLPTKRDLTSAVQALVRLQEIYGEQADFTSPSNIHPHDTLTANELFDIAKLTMDEGNYYSALINMEKSWHLFLAADDIPNAMVACDYLAYLMYQQGNPDYALNYTYILLSYYRHFEYDKEMMTRLEGNVRLYIDSLGGEEAAEERVKLPYPYKNEPPFLQENYKELCRGESIKIHDRKVDSPLKCRLVTNSSPLLMLAPARVEEINAETGLSFFHDVLTDNEVQLFRSLAANKFEDSELAVNNSDANSPVDASIRSSNTGWIDDLDDSRISAVSRRISAITGLDTSSAEQFQVLSYGVGGFYLPHYDYSESEGAFPEHGGNRIATWIFYLSDIVKGGATVFPDIGAAVWPKKGGAAFWWNLRRNGKGNEKTLHAACPVLEGYKWASNKWFHEHGNEFNRPCDLKEST